MSVRGVRQLSHLFVSYKPGMPSSRVVEEFISSPLLQQFKEKYPDVRVDAVPTGKNNPFLSAAYGQDQRQGGRHTRRGGESSSSWCERVCEIRQARGVHDLHLDFGSFRLARPLPLCPVNKHGSQLSLVDCRTPEGVLSLCQRLADQIGRAPGQLGSIKRKPFAQTATRSLQGAWQPTFVLKSNEDQLKPLQQVQTHILGLAPEMDAPAPKPAAIVTKPAKKQ